MPHKETAMSEGLLQGLRVLDFGRYVAGPYCATLLGYLGAEIIRVEKRSGSEDRYIHPLCQDESGQPGEGALFWHTGCNKRSLTLDPASPEGREIVRRLVATADIIVASLPEPELLRLGLDHESLTAIRPDIILVTQSGFGPRGPESGRAGFDGVGQAMSGAMYFSGLPGQPMKAAAAYVDFSTALLSAFGALAALLERQKSGRGQRVDAALLRSALAVFGPFVTEESALRLDRPPTGNRVQTSGPSDCFAVRDGHVLIHTVGSGLFRKLARLIGAENWLDDPALASDEGRGLARDRLCAGMAEWCRSRTRDEAIAELSQAGIPAGPVLSPAEAVRQPHLAAAGWARNVETPAGPALVMDMPLDFSVTSAGIRKNPPALGADTDALLNEIGYSAAEIEALRRKAVI